MSMFLYFYTQPPDKHKKGTDIDANRSVPVNN